MSTSIGERLTAATPIVTIGVGLAALFAGFDWWWMVFAFGWVVLTPLIAILTGTDSGGEWDAEADPAPTDQSSDQSVDEESKQEALETLRDRYARGELSEEQFERKLERLLSTETFEDARDHVTGEAGDERGPDGGDGSDEYDPFGTTDAGEVRDDREPEREP